MIYAANDEILDEFCDRIAYTRTPSLRGIVYSAGGQIQAVVGFDGWTPNSVQLHVWVGGSISRRFIRECLAYAFITCEKGLVIGVTPGYNAPALEFNARIGFKKVFELPDAWETGTSMVIQVLRKEDCRWLRGSNVQEHSSGT